MTELYKAARKLARELESAHDDMWLPDDDAPDTDDLDKYKELENRLWTLVIEYEELASQGEEN